MKTTSKKRMPKTVLIQKARHAFREFTSKLSPSRSTHTAIDGKSQVPSLPVQWTINVPKVAVLAVFIKAHPEYANFRQRLSAKGDVCVVQEQWSELLRRHQVSPVLAMAGWLKDDPMFDKWRAEVEAYRRQCDIDAGIDYDERS
jgi:hypothetical protein